MIGLIGARGFIGKEISKVLKEKKASYREFSSNAQDDYRIGINDERSWKNITSKNWSQLILLSWPRPTEYEARDIFSNTLPNLIRFVEFVTENRCCEKLIVLGTCYEYGVKTGKVSET